MSRKKKKKPAAAVETLPKLKKDLPTKELSFTLTVPRRLAYEYWEMRHHWNAADPGWNWVKMPFMCIVLVRLEPSMRSLMPALLEVGQRISSGTFLFEIHSPTIQRDAEGLRLEAMIDPCPVLRDFQIRLAGAAVAAGFSLQERIGLPIPRVILGRRQDGVEPSRVRPTKLMTEANVKWVASKAHLVEGRVGYDAIVTTSLSAWPLVRSRSRR